MTFAEYVKIDAVNWSTLKEARRSMRHYAHRVAQPMEDTTRLALGRAAHTAILEPDRFPLDYVVWKGGDRRGKAWAEFCEQHPGETILKLDEYEACLAMKKAVHDHPVAGKLLKVGSPEYTLTWTDEDTGLACKGRLDWLRGDMLLDLKTTGDLDPQRFGLNAARMGYHNQIAFYLMGLRSKRIEVPAKIVAVEAEPPHDVAVIALSEDDLYAGECEVKTLLANVKACRESKVWPGRCPGEVPLWLPPWVFDQSADDDVTGLGLVVSEAAEG